MRYRYIFSGDLFNERAHLAGLEFHAQFAICRKASKRKCRKWQAFSAKGILDKILESI
jgi:hypothetical protein